MYNDWQYSNQISHRRLRYKNLDGKKANSTPFQKNKTKQLPFPYAYIELVKQRELKSSKWYTLGVNKHFNFVE